MLTKKSASVKFFNMIGMKRINLFSLYAHNASNILQLLGNGRPGMDCDAYNCDGRHIMLFVAPSGGLSGRSIFFDRT